MISEPINDQNVSNGQTPADTMKSQWDNVNPCEICHLTQVYRLHRKPINKNCIYGAYKVRCLVRVRRMNLNGSTSSCKGRAHKHNRN